ncbi:uncharacterized protein LOC125227953 [Leguminivora glycinivorella]|uniref:uncharacterized protein LOC125227953 n=1 Tax=Leguminivora glycinivorella TaxID=1035111 RepID=UPI00200CBAA3|nr:uncharacterized protein LOC125227953 [Leguminivora glycinivorella]
MRRALGTQPGETREHNTADLHPKKPRTHRFHDKMSPDPEAEASEDMLESIDELKERLSSMKRLMEERKAAGTGTKDLFQGHAASLQGTNMIDGNFLSFVFGGSLVVILSVSVYAFYNLYHAVLKKFPSTHTEL